MTKYFEVSVSVEKVFTRLIEAESEYEAIEIIKDQLMNGSEDFAQILDIEAKSLK